MKKHKNGGNHFCNDCQIDCETLAKYKYHRLKKHGKWQKPFECKSCTKEFATKSNLTKHCKLTHLQGKAVSQSVQRSLFTSRFPADSCQPLRSFHFTDFVENSDWRVT